MNMKKISLLCYIILLVLGCAENASAASQIDTSNIYIMAYYKAAPEIDLSTAIQEFDTVTESTGQYVEGELELWHNNYPTGRNKGDIADLEIRDGVTTNISFSTKVKVRVKSDGWIVAWLTNDQNPNDMVFWNNIGGITYSPSDTTIGKAIWRVTDKLNMNYNKSEVKYYSYKYPEANRLKIGGSHTETSRTYYFLLPSTITPYEANLLWTSYMQDGSYPIIINNIIKMDGETIYNKSTTAAYVGTYEYTRNSHPLTQERDTRHTLYIKASKSGSLGDATIKSTIMLLYKSG